MNVLVAILKYVFAKIFMFSLWSVRYQSEIFLSINYICKYQALTDTADFSKYFFADNAQYKFVLLCDLDNALKHPVRHVHLFPLLTLLLKEKFKNFLIRSVTSWYKVVALHPPAPQLIQKAVKG